MLEGYRNILMVVMDWAKRAGISPMRFIIDNALHGGYPSAGRYPD